MTGVWNLVFHIFHTKGSEWLRAAIARTWRRDSENQSVKDTSSSWEQSLKSVLGTLRSTMWERLHMECGSLCVAVLLCSSFLGFRGPCLPCVVTLRPRAAWALGGPQYRGLAHLCPTRTSPQPLQAAHVRWSALPADWGCCPRTVGWTW